MMENVKISDVAKLAKVSRAAAGKVLNGGTSNIRVGDQSRKRILSAAAKLGYRQNMAASILAGGSSRLIGMLVEPDQTYRNLKLQQEIEHVCAQRGYRVIASFTHDSIENLRDNYLMLLKYGIEGVICCAHDYPMFRDEIAGVFAGDPKVVFMEKPQFDCVDYVATSRTEALKRMIADAVGQGCRRIGMLSGALVWRSEQVLHEEFCRAMRENNLEVNSELVGEYIQSHSVVERCEWIMERVIRRGRPDFLFIDDATHAVSLQTRLRQLNYEITIHGGNGDPLFGNVVPAIKSFDPQYRLIAEKLLDRILDKQSACRCETVEAKY